MRRVLITGVTGFAGSHLVDHLLTRNDCEIHGIWRWRSRTENIEHLKPGQVTFHECDLRDATSAHDVIDRVRPDWIFHLAAQSFVPTSWVAPTESLTTNILAQLNIFEPVRRLKLKTRIQLACSSEEYGMVLPGRGAHQGEQPVAAAVAVRGSKVAQDMLGYQYWMSWKVDSRAHARDSTTRALRRGPVFVASDFAKQIADIEKGRKPRS
jgi:GDP-4-dehydro-6-deoxy-D-mannose reductase